MQHVHITQGIDVASVVLYSFWLFFAGLILYLRREDRREGYPLEHEDTGAFEPQGGLFFTADPKTFILPHGLGTVTTPTKDREPQRAGMRRTAPWGGSPYEPVGDPLADGVGPASYAERAKRPDLTLDGHPKIVPLRVAKGFGISANDPDPRGMKLFGSDGVIGGVITDVWVDQSERMIRYLEVRTMAEPARIILAPMTMVSIHGGRGLAQTDSIAGHQFAGAPGLDRPDQVTLYEEERTISYFGGGYLYASASRSEPLI